MIVNGLAAVKLSATEEEPAAAMPLLEVRCVDIRIRYDHVNLEALMIMSWSCHKDMLECNRPIRCEITYGKGEPDAAIPLSGA